MSKEAEDFIYRTDLIGQHDYQNNDCGEGYLLPADQLATILEAYHQEQMKKMQPTSTFTIDWGNATHSPINNVTTPPPKESGTGVSFGDRTVERSELNKGIQETFNKAMTDAIEAATPEQAEKITAAMKAVDVAISLMSALQNKTP